MRAPRQAQGGAIRGSTTLMERFIIPSFTVQPPTPPPPKRAASAAAERGEPGGQVGGWRRAGVAVRSATAHGPAPALGGARAGGGPPGPAAPRANRPSPPPPQHLVPAHVHHADAAAPPARPRRALDALFSPVLTLLAAGGACAPPSAHAGTRAAHAAAHHKAAGPASPASPLAAAAAASTDRESALPAASASVAGAEESASDSDGAAAAAAAAPAADTDDDDDDECGDEFVEFDPYAFIKALPPLSSCPPAPAPPRLPARTRACAARATLVLDLDETLVHSTLGAPPPTSDFAFDVALAGRTHAVHVATRPGLQPFLERCAQLFEVVVFTASQRVYAARLLDAIDPGRRLIRHRVYREACVVVDGNYLKDLSSLGRDLARVVIVDNSPQAFGFQLDNGIPIESWYDDTADGELARLLPLLESLADAADVRPLLAVAFRLRALVAAAPDVELVLQEEG